MYKITLMVNGQEFTLLLNREDYSRLNNLLRHGSNTYQAYEENERERLKAKRKAEQEAREKARTSGSRGASYTFFVNGEPMRGFHNFDFSGFFDAEEAFRKFSETASGYAGRDDGHRSGPGSSRHYGYVPPPRPESPKPHTVSRQEYIRKLHTLAGLAYPSQLDEKRVYRRAMRKCHPDSGGSHQKWIELEKIKVALGI